MALQDEFLAGKISQSELQKCVRDIVQQGRPSNSAGENSTEQESDLTSDGSFWYHSQSKDGVWEALSTHNRDRCELLFQRTTSGSRVAIVYRYQVRLRKMRCSGARFHLALLRRFSHQDLACEDAIDGADLLLAVTLTYAPNERSVASRWAAAKKLVTSDQSDDHASILVGVRALQHLFRYGELPRSAKAEKVIEAVTEAAAKAAAVTEASDKANEAMKKKLKQQEKNRKKKIKKKSKLKTKDGDYENEKLGGQEANAQAQSTLETQVQSRDVDDAQEHANARTLKQPDGSSTNLASEGNCLGSNDGLGLREKHQSAAAAAAAGESREESNSSLQHSPERLALVSRELVELASFLEKTIDSKRLHRNQLMWLLQGTLSRVFPCVKVHLFGSHASGFALPSSDLDFYFDHQEGACFEGLASHHQYYSSSCRMAKLPVLEQLEFVQNALRGEQWVKSLTLIRSAAIPVIRISTCVMALEGEAEDTHLTSGASHLCPKCWMVDLSCGASPGHSNRIFSGLLREKQDQFPLFRPLMLVLKQMLSERRLCDVFTGGISSFSLSLLVLRYLQHLRQHPDELLVQSTPSKTDISGDTSNSPQAQQALAKLYQREYAKWPGGNVANYMPPAFGAKRPGRGVRTTPLVPNQIQDYYHRQLADWPSSDAAHHWDWMNARAPALTPMLLSPRQTRSIPAPNSDQSKQAFVDRVDMGRNMDGNTSGSSSGTSSSSSSSSSSDDSMDQIGLVFTRFLDFYGNRFSPSSVGVTVIGDGAFYSVRDYGGMSRAPQPITIDNPMWPSISVGRSSYRISAVFDALREIYAKLLVLLENDEPSILRNLVKAKWGMASTGKVFLENAFLLHQKT